MGSPPRVLIVIQISVEREGQPYEIPMWSGILSLVLATVSFI